ncbi:MAG: transposase [Patescibacteria group bacterium]
MPSRNRLKAYVSDGYYHIYNRGANKRKIFIDEEDYSVFLNLIKRHLADQPTKDRWGREYNWLHQDMELLSFCLMPNHFHLLIYQRTPKAMTSLMHDLGGAYASYFNKKHRRQGPLFQDRFKASLIDRDEYLQHISRYIHLNPESYESWDFSSLSYFLNHKKASWINPQRILTMFREGEYKGFVSDYRSHKKMLDEIKLELANSADL